MFIRQLLPSFRISQKDTHNCLNVEALEERMMLSSVEIFAAGATGQENLELFINDDFQQTFFNVGGDASTGDFQRLVFETDQALTPGDIGIGFANDLFDPSTGLDRNLFVDRIVVDGVSVEAEDPSTFSTGIYRDGLTGPGFFQVDFLNINGILSFADPGGGGGDGSGDRIEFDALGTTGEELVDVVINGQTVASFGLDNAGVTETFSFTSSDPNISIEDVRLEFVNDLFDPASGIDRNVQIFEFRVIDGDTGLVESARTTDANVLNSGIFVDGVGITEGFGAGGFLAGDFSGNAFVEIADNGGGPIDVGGGSGDRIEFDAFGTTGEEIIDVLVNGQTVASFGLDNPGVTQTFSFTSDDPNIAIEDIRLEFVNDLFDPSTGFDRNVQIFEYRVIDSDTGQVQTAQTTDANVLNSGAFDDNTGNLVQQFGAGGFLAGESFAFDGVFVEISSEGAGFLPSDPGFQSSQDVSLSVIEVGPQDQIAGVTNFTPAGVFIESPDVLVVGSDGVPLNFGDNGRVNIAEVLGSRTGIVDPIFEISDLEFFDDGSLLVVGNVRAADGFILGFREPLIVKLNPDGTLDESFSQQGILTGTSIRLDGFPTPLEAAIDPLGRVVVFAVNNEIGIGPASNNFVVSRLQTDGSIDTTFGDNGNVFILSPEAGAVGPPSLSRPINLAVDDVGEITFGIAFEEPDPTSAFPFAEIPAVAIGRLTVDGTFDPGFGDNGFFIQSGFSIARFELAPGGVVVVAGSFEADSPQVPNVILLNSGGDPFAEVTLDPNSEVGIATGSNFVGELLVDQFGNILIQTTASGIDSPDPNATDVAVVQRILSTGEIDTEFGLGGAAVVGNAFEVRELAFDSQNRLIVAGDDLNRFEI